MPKTPLDNLKLRVFEDFHNRNYYLTSGTNFGGDFLAYPGNFEQIVYAIPGKFTSN